LTRTLALVPWDISKPQSGGTQRCHALLTAIPDLTTFALVWDEKAQTHQKIGGMNYRAIYAGDEAVNRAAKLFRQGITSYDPIPRLVDEELTALREAIDEYDPDLMLLHHPWLIDLTCGRPFIYDAHNCESVATMQRMGKNSLDYDLVHELEHDAVIEAEHITYCSEADWRTITRTWPNHADGTHIPNGTHIPKAQTNGKKLNLIFVGSYYLPNVYAAQRLADIGRRLPEYQIHLVGGASLGVETNATNVTRHGVISDDKLEQLLNEAHIFVNSVSNGSGTSLKIPQALAHGIPVVSTTIGARGYETEVSISDDLEEYPAIIRTITADWKAHHNTARRNAHNHDWANIRQDYARVIRALQ